MPENNVNNEAIENTNANLEVIDIPESPEKDDKGDIIVGVAGAVVCLLAVPTVIRAGKWIWGKVSGFIASRKNDDDEEFEEDEQ